MLVELELILFDLSEDDDDDDLEFIYMVKKRLGKENIFKGMFNILCIYYGNDFSEFFGVMGNYNFDILGVDNIDVGCGNLIII